MIELLTASAFLSIGAYMFLNHRNIKTLSKRIEKLETQFKELEKKTSIIRR